MPISKAPQRRPPSSDTSSVAPDEAQIMAVINKGGSVPNERPGQLEEVDQDRKRGFELRLYQTMIDEIDAARKKVRRGKQPSRNAWIVAAIEEKLEREGTPQPK